LTFKRVIRKKSTEEFSCFPYIMALLVSFLYTWYGLPVKKVAMMTVPVVLVICITATISAFIFHDHHHRKLFVGSVVLLSSAALYASPLVAVSPNLIGTPLAILQLVLYFKYRNKGIVEEPHKSDAE
ncbi:hypothetical protein C3L33_03319, partial [Rhododendron williamsianum]